MESFQSDSYSIGIHTHTCTCTSIAKKKKKKKVLFFYSVMVFDGASTSGTDMESLVNEKVTVNAEHGITGWTLVRL